MADPEQRRDGSPQVSFDDEPLIVVDESGRTLGYRSKVECHEGRGILHRAFSVFLFDERGRLLLQQRASEKPLWPLYWSNSVCSHPRRGETEDVAAQRRVEEEVGLVTELEFLYRFQYHAPFEDRGSERELCAVYLGRVSGEVRANQHEIADWKWIAVEELDRAIAEDPDAFTPWLKLEWARLRGDLWDRVRPYASPR